jgi:ABC-type amino acid transport system permease subunit
MSMSGGQIPMEPAQPRWRLSDPAAWGIFASGIAVLVVAAYVIIVFENVAAIYERRGVFQFMFFAASALALSGPMVATIGQLFPSTALTISRKTPKATGLEDL